MTKRKVYLDMEDFHKALRLLDAKLGTDPMIMAFAPIRMIVAGGFFSVMYLKNRKTTTDMDFLLDPEWANDEDIKVPLQKSIREVANEAHYMEDWANEDVGVFVTEKTRKILMEDAIKQNIVLWASGTLLVFAAPVEWALERKLRRIYCAERGRKAELDLADAVAMLKFMKERKGGKLDKEYCRTLNKNGFDVMPDVETMNCVAAAYKATYGEDAFL
ncbi:hypothetical protein AtubIFM57143_007985 [Aspergillus tubingensis]|nr:hypothetical protein AtubIFM57143_007985 [Aspergillus tubingensis]